MKDMAGQIEAAYYEMTESCKMKFMKFYFKMLEILIDSYKDKNSQEFINLLDDINKVSVRY